MNGTKVNTIILSAGLSSRMAQPKALLTFGRTTFIENIYSEFAPESHRVVVVVSPKLYITMREKDIKLDADFVFNHRPQYGRFYSVYLGVRELGPSSIFIQNVDIPGVSSSTLRVMKEALEPRAYVVPIYKGRRGHPVLISKEIADEILRIDRDYERVNLRSFLNQFTEKQVNVDDEFVTLNVNTPSDLDVLYNRVSKIKFS